MFIPMKAISPDNADRVEEILPQASGSAFAQAREEALKAGNPVLQIEGNGLYRITPDRKKELIRQVEPWTSSKDWTKGDPNKVIRF